MGFFVLCVFLKCVSQTPMLLRLLMVLALLVLVFPGHAYASPLLTDQARQKGLAHHPYWKALLHYRSGSDAAVAGEIISPEFYLSENGRYDAEGELIATIEAMLALPDIDHNKHAQCRFVARYLWLRKMLDWKGVNSPHLTCENYSKWSLDGRVDGISLMFASGYLGNPASIYGHLLLKFNSSHDTLDADLLDRSINFGAIIPEHENPLMYMTKGLLGGYDATFSHAMFYHFNHNYTENELRDLWEYRLDLSQDEINQLVSHAWELMGMRFTYYFLKENCAYQMAVLLRLVVDQDLLPKGLPWSIPAVVPDNLTRIVRDGFPLVSEVKQIPSRQNIFYTKYFALDDGKKEIVLSLVTEDWLHANEAYHLLSEDEKILIIDVLLEYYEYRIIRESNDVEYKKKKHQLLIERLALPGVKMANEKNVAQPSPPHEGPLPGMMQIGALHNTKYGYGFDISMRPAYYDFLSLDAGRQADSKMTMLDLRVSYLDEKVVLRYLDIVNIEALNISQTSMPGDGGYAWKLRFGVESAHLGCDECTVVNARGGIGKAVLLRHGITASGMLEGLLQTEYQNRGTVGAIIGVSIFVSPIRDWKTYFTIGHQSYLNGSKEDEMLLLWDNRWAINRQWDIKFSYEMNVEREFRTAFSIYW